MNNFDILSFLFGCFAGALTVSFFLIMDSFIDKYFWRTGPRKATDKEMLTILNKITTQAYNNGRNQHENH